MERCIGCELLTGIPVSNLFFSIIVVQWDSDIYYFSVMLPKIGVNAYV